jgi:hypothetical protein
MDHEIEIDVLKLDRQTKLNELQDQQNKLNELQTELERIGSKLRKKEKLSAEDTKFIGDLGWLATVSVTVAAIASSL